MFSTINNHIKFALLFLLSLMILPSMIACNDDDDDSGADPVIRYCRSTYATKADSMIVAASWGNVIAIVGENLSNVKSISFNDKSATLNTCYITDEAIVVTVPTGMPTEQTNKIYLTAKNGNVISYNFQTTPPAPLLSSINCLMLKEGNKITIKGNYFVEPCKIIIGSSVIDATVNSINEISAILPAGVETASTLSVLDDFGITEFGTKINSTSCMMANMDDLPVDNWSEAVVTNANNPLSGNYLHFEKAGFGPWQWCNPFASKLSAKLADWKGDVSNTYFAFEVRTNKPWTLSGSLSLNFVNTEGSCVDKGNWETAMTKWCPYEDEADGIFDTKGEWQTVFIPLSSTIYHKSGAVSTTVKAWPNELVNFICMFWSVPISGNETGTCDLDIDMDNFRLIVK